MSFQVWNNIGIVRSHSEEEPASIDIEFHDSSLHHSMNIINQMNHTMAALSDTAVLLACQANEELERYRQYNCALYSIIVLYVFRLSQLNNVVHDSFQNLASCCVYISVHGIVLKSGVLLCLKERISWLVRRRVNMLLHSPVCLIIKWRHPYP